MVTGVTLPVSVAAQSGSGLAVIDYRAISATSEPAAGGVCSLTFEQVPPSLFWLIDRTVVSCTSVAVTTARLYTGQITPDRLENATPAGNLDVDDSNAPLLVDSSSVLIVTWTGATAGAVGTARIQYRIMRRS